MTNRNASYRILDANLNRAREAFRVMEEYARFVLDDALLTRDLKQLRHQLADAIPTVISDPIISYRDITRDVGKEVTVGSEFNRAELSSVVIAAGKRLSEALRAIEEYGKTIDSKFAASIEAIRYLGYELERRLVLTARSRQRFRDRRLYVILTESFCENDWYETARAAMRGGADCLQLREKSLSDREFLDRAKKLVKLCHENDALFIINDRLDIAALVHADGVHLGQDDVTIEEARRLLPDTTIIGMSTHTKEQIISAARSTADYIAVGPMYATNTKPQHEIAGIETLQAARNETSLPLVAIGGIHRDQISDVLSAVECTICVCTAVIAQADVESACQNIRNTIDQAQECKHPQHPHRNAVT